MTDNLYSKKGKVLNSIFDNVLINMLDGFKTQTPKQVLDYIRNKFMKQIVPEFKSSNKIVEKYLYEITLQEDTRLMVILANLHLEQCIEVIISKKLKNPVAIKKFEYHEKLLILNSIGILEDDLFEDICLVNSFRNNFAHNLNFKIDKMQLKRISSLKKYDIIDIFSKDDEIKEYYHYILSLFLFKLINDLSLKYAIIIDEHLK